MQIAISQLHCIHFPQVWFIGKVSHATAARIPDADNPSHVVLCPDVKNREYT
jgi:hypothetical protein